MGFVRDAEATESGGSGSGIQLTQDQDSHSLQVGFAFCLIKTPPVQVFKPMCASPLLSSMLGLEVAFACSGYAWVLVNGLVQTGGAVPATVACFRFSGGIQDVLTNREVLGAEAGRSQVPSLGSLAKF